MVLYGLFNVWVFPLFLYVVFTLMCLCVVILVYSVMLSGVVMFFFLCACVRGCVFVCFVCGLSCDVVWCVFGGAVRVYVCVCVSLGFNVFVNVVCDVLCGAVRLVCLVFVAFCVVLVRVCFVTMLFMCVFVFRL